MPEDGNSGSAEDQRLRVIIDCGAEIAGGVVGGALGFLAEGPAGAAAFGAGGIAAALALRRMGHEVSERLLGPRERARIGGVLAIAAAEIDNRLKNGESIRSDGFFDQKPHGRSDADEVAESVLLRSQREPEEQKIPYMAHLLSSVPFDDQIGAQMAHQIIKAAEQLTYRQMCLMHLAVMKDAFGLRNGDYRGVSSFPRDLTQVLYECLDLYHRAFVNFGGSVVFGPTDVNPGQMTVQGLGAELYNLMMLDTIPMDQLNSIAAQLK